MKIRGLLAAVLVSVALSACGRSATAPETPAQPVLVAPDFNETPPPPPDTTTNRGGGALGNGH